jgi:hypothetical protein
LPEHYFGDVDRRFGDRERRQRGIDRRRGKGSIAGYTARSRYHVRVKPRKRPLILAVLSLWPLLGLVVSPVFLFTSSHPELADSLSARPEMGLWHSIAYYTGPVGVAITGFSLMFGTGIVGFGLWWYQQWARVALIGIAGADVLWGVYEIIRSLVRLHAFDFGAAIFIAIYAIPLVYLQSRKIRVLFQRPQRA